MSIAKLRTLKIVLTVLVVSLLVFLSSPHFAAQQEPKSEEKKQAEQKPATTQGQNGEEVSFKDIQAIFKEQKCVVCHRGENPSGLDLLNEVAYKNLVNAKSTQDPETLLVKPGDPDASYLFVKLNGPGKNGTIMPPKGKLPQEIVDKVAAWIKQGAKNN